MLTTRIKITKVLPKCSFHKRRSKRRNWWPRENSRCTGGTASTQVTRTDSRISRIAWRTWGWWTRQRTSTARQQTWVQPRAPPGCEKECRQRVRTWWEEVAVEEVAQVEAELVAQLEAVVLEEQASRPLEPSRAQTREAKAPTRASLSIHLKHANTAPQAITNMLWAPQLPPSTTRQSLLIQQRCSPTSSRLHRSVRSRPTWALPRNPDSSLPMAPIHPNHAVKRVQMWLLLIRKDASPPSIRSQLAAVQPGKALTESQDCVNIQSQEKSNSNLTARVLATAR